MVSNYFYRLLFGFVHLGVPCEFSVYRTGLSLIPDDNDARPVLDSWRDAVTDSAQADDNAAAAILLALRNAYSAETTIFTSFQAMYYRQSIGTPIVANASFSVAGLTGVSESNTPSGQNSITYYAPASEYRTRGAGFRLPCPSDAYMKGNTWETTLYTSSLGLDAGAATWSLLEILNPGHGYNGWGVDGLGGSVPPVNIAVVKRVPNNAPHGNGNGYRLPTFPGDTVQATWCDPFGIQSKVGTAQSRRQ